MNIKIGNKTVNINVKLDEIIDYNAENGFIEGAEDGLFTPNWFGINVNIDINDASIYIQIQYDNQNSCWSLDCDGNIASEMVKGALLDQFTHDDLYTVETYPNGNVAKRESDLYCDIINTYLPQVESYICGFGATAFNDFSGE